MTLGSILLTLLGLLILAALAVVAYAVVRTQLIAAKARKVAPPRGIYRTIDGNRIHYVDQWEGQGEGQGNGRPIVFVHGLGGQLNHFRGPLFPLLSGYRLVALDRPGSGYSTRPFAASAALAEQAKVIAAFIGELGLEKPLVVGHSLGGAVSLTLALNHPDKVGGLALIAPLTHHRDDTPPQFKALEIRSALKRWLLAQTVSVPLSLKFAQQTLDFVFGPQAVTPDYASEGGGWAGLRPSHVYATGTDFMALENVMPGLQARYGELAMPVGILFGSADRVLEVDRHGLAMQGKVRGLDLEILDGIGHMPQFVEAEKTAAFIRRQAERVFGG